MRTTLITTLSTTVPTPAAWGASRPASAGGDA